MAGKKLLNNCKNCQVELDLTNFVYTKSSRLNSCRTCYNKYKRRVNKANYHDHVGRVKQWHKDYHLQKTYGLNTEDVQSKLQIQLNGCAICKIPFNEETKSIVDHNHTTNIPRDLLCYKCNNLVGHLENSEELFIEAIEYLKRHNQRKIA